MLDYFLFHLYFFSSIYEVLTNDMLMKIAIIGGGAAGFFAAISAKENYPDSQVVVFEKSNKTLAKVKISGGGRCNVTNGCLTIKELSEAYPRGSKQLKKMFHLFSNKHAMQWFDSRGVPLVVQDDNRVFPASNDSNSIIECFHAEKKRLGIELYLGKDIKALNQVNKQWEIVFLDTNVSSSLFDKVIVASGGSPKRKNLEWLERLGHVIETPVPSLFTFNMPDEEIRQLMGVVADNVQVRIQGTKLKSNGALLITHWGMSGPAILKLSAFGARLLNERNYEFSIQVNWVNVLNSEMVIQELERLVKLNANKFLANVKPYALPDRLWLFLLNKCELPQDKKWNELGKKGINKMVNILTNDIYFVKGKTTFKEEFVTCGGVSLDSIDCTTMQSKICSNLYFAGEIMDVDGITGGYNFQAAWTTAFIAGKLN